MAHFRNKLYSIQKVMRDQNTNSPVIVLKRLGKSKLHSFRLDEKELNQIITELGTTPKTTMKT